MPTTVTASMRDLRNRFPKLKKIVKAGGELNLSERDGTEYVLKLKPKERPKAFKPVDYAARLRARRSKPMTAAQAKAFHDELRGNR